MDCHIRSGIFESCVMLGATYDYFEPWPWVNDCRHLNYPMPKWVRSTKQNFDYTLQYGFALCEEFGYRFDKIHKSQSILEWISRNLPMDNLHDTILTDWPRSFGNFRSEIDTTNDAVRDFREYYRRSKKHLARWTRREIPDWYYI